MKDLLARSEKDLFLRFCRPGTLLAFDFDGTLAPLTPHRDDAWLEPSTRNLLRELARRYPCAVISGRGHRDIARRVRGIPFREVIGNHGAEWKRTPRALTAKLLTAKRAVSEWRRALEPLFQREAGLDLEDKRYSLSLHYRAAPDRVRALRALRRAVAALPRDRARVRVIDGKLVLNVVPAGLPHKGEALVTLRRQLKAPRMIFLGDDVTDEDVFRLESARLLGVRIGRKRGSAASHYLKDQTTIDRYLEGVLLGASA